MAAAPAPSSLGSQIREELSCSICLELFTRPKMLPCMHTFCQHCLQNLASTRLPLQCPNCRLQVLRPPPEGVAGLPDNYIVASMCERLQNQAALSEETREQPQSGNRCSFHPSEELKLYCKECQVPVCNECFEEGHEGHPTMSLRKASQERSATVQASIQDGRNILETYVAFLRDLREKDKSLDDNKQQTDNSIMEAYQQAHQKLIEQKDRLLSEVVRNHRQNKGAIQGQRDAVLAHVAALSSACDGAEEQMAREGGEFHEQGTNLPGLVRQFREKTLPSPVQTHPATFQQRNTEEVVGTLGRVSVPSASLTFGENGSGPGQFKLPSGVAVSDEGEIFVADCNNHRIQVFTLQKTFARHFQTVMPGERKMYPHDVAMDGEGNLWVVGRTGPAEFAVQYNKQGRVLRKFDLQYTGVDRGVAVDTRRNHILVTQTTGDWAWDNTHGEVQVFRPDGTLVRTVGQQQGMKHPMYITVDGEGKVLVSDSGNHHIYLYSKDGQFLFQFGAYGSGEGRLNYPRGICTDRAGNIIVADSGNNRVELFDKTGRFLKHITTDMNQPLAVAMATQGQLVVTSYEDHTITIFQTC